VILSDWRLDDRPLSMRVGLKSMYYEYYLWWHGHRMKESEEERAGGARTMNWIGSSVWLAGEETILNGPARGPLIVTSRFGEFLSMNDELEIQHGFRYYYSGILFHIFLVCTKFEVRTDWTDINK
jgi:hypothetical protein